LYCCGAPAAAAAAGLPRFRREALPARVWLASCYETRALCGCCGRYDALVS
jgi:hypothetical protein